MVLTTGKGDSTRCWGTNLGTGGHPPAGGIDTAANSILRSRNIDLSGVAGAELQFAAAIDYSGGDIIEVLVREFGTNNLIATVEPFGANPLALLKSADWANYGPFDISAGAGMNCYLEFRFQGTDSSFIGLYIDDITVTETP